MAGVVVVAASAGPAQAVPAQSTGTTLATATAPKPASPRQEITYFVGLTRDEGAAEKALRVVADPGSTGYRRFPDRQTIQQKYGASAATVARVRRVVERWNLTFALDETGVFGSISGRARNFTRWLGTPVLQREAPLATSGTGVSYYSKVKAAPASLKGAVREFLPLDEQFDYRTLQLGGGVGIDTATQMPADNTGTPEGCQTQDPSLSASTYSYNELRHAYGVDQLDSSAEVGAATRMVILSFGVGFGDDSLKASAECNSLPQVTFERVSVPGTSGPLPEDAGGGGEGDLDVQVAQSVLPQGSKVTVVEGSGHESSRGFLTWATAYSLPDVPDVVTTSYGGCESKESAQLGGQDLTLTQSVLLRLALAGTSSFSAAGDSGSSACWNDDTQKGPEGLAVNYATSSPYLTAVGGSDLTLNADNTRANEIVWNTSDGGKAGGGGGVSTLFDRPWWQPESDTRSKKRTVPDITAHASSLPAWPLTQGARIEQVSGTSAASPFLAASFAIIAAQERVAGRPALGLLPPWLYQLQKNDSTAFFDVVSGNNDLFDKGCCTASPGYDEASGLGAPVLPQVAAQIPAPGSAP